MLMLVVSPRLAKVVPVETSAYDSAVLYRFWPRNARFIPVVGED